MRHLPFLAFVLLLPVMIFPSLAQEDNLITLNDATPAIDVVITLPPDTTGTILLDLAQASVTLKDANGAVVFNAADSRLHGVAFNITPNSGSHTLTVERLSGVTEAFVNITSLPEMTFQGEVEMIESDTLTLNQETTFLLDSNNPVASVMVDFPAQTRGAMTATFPNAFATTQLVDQENVVMAESIGGHVDGLSFVLDAGHYDFILLGNTAAETVVMGVRVVSAEDGGFTVIEAPVSTTEAITTNATCTATIIALSANLRSGPGTGYSVLNYAYRNETYPVGGHNQESNWIVVGTPNGESAWLALSAAQMQGACESLTVFDVPLREATPAQIVITSSNGHYDDDDDDHHGYEEHEDDDDEYEHDDD